MIYYFWTDSIDNESLQDFFNFVNKNGAPKVMYFTSAGGYLPHTEVLIDFINEYKISLILYNKICSAALYLAKQVQTDVTILKGTIGMVHKPSVNLLITSDNVDFDNYNEVMKESMGCWETIDGFLDILTEEQIEMYKKNIDVWLTSEQLKEYLC